MRRVLAAYRDAYSGLPRATWVLAAVCFVNRCGTMVLPFLMLYLTSQRGFSAAAGGIVVSLYGIGAGVGAFCGGVLTDRVGAKRVQVASLALAGLGFLLLGQLRAPLWIQLAAFALGAVNESFRPANGAAFAAAVRPEQVTQALTLRRLALNLGMTCGPMLGGFLAARDYAWLFVTDGGTCLLAAGLLAALDRSHAPAPVSASEAAAAISPWSDGAFLALLVLVAGHATVLYQFFSTYPLALHELHGLPEPQIGSVYLINTLLIVALEMVLVRRLALAAPLGVAAWGMLLFAGGFALLPFGRGYAFVAATVVVWTFGEMLTMPFLETVAAGRGDARSRGRYLGAFNLAYSVSFAGAPALGAWIYQRFGAVPLFAGIGAVGVVLWFALRVISPRLARRRTDSDADAAAPAVAALVPPAP
ncbi:MAG TPA: MFS transporter [Thermoanaerobaculia bacterium]|nr:MFS transporter [Thermoanaerobaculia bacterium]